MDTEESKKRHDAINENFGKVFQWQVDHAQEDRGVHEEDRNSFKEIGARFDSVESNMSALPSKEDIEKIVHATLINFFTSKGILSKNIIVTTAVVIGSLVVIGGGLKWLLGLIGFSYMSK